MKNSVDLEKRRFLTVNLGQDAGVHISSAVVLAFPERSAEVARSVAELPGVEVHRIEKGRIIATIESENSGAIGERLIQISLLDGVLAANLVFEQFEPFDERPSS